MKRETNERDRANRMLGLDSGKRNLGLVYVKQKTTETYDTSDWQSYEIKWFYLMDLNLPNTETEEPEDATGRCTFYDELQRNIINLQSLKEHPYLTRKMSRRTAKTDDDDEGKIDFCTEQIEGVSNADVLFHLMRVNFVSGYVCATVSSFPRCGNVTVLPKTAKWGWKSINAVSNGICSGKYDRISAFDDDFRFDDKLNKVHYKGNREKYLKPARIGDNKSKLSQRKRDVRKVLVCDVVRYMIAFSELYDEDFKRYAQTASDDDFNHVADAALQCMWLIKKNHHERTKRKMQEVRKSREMQNTLAKDVMDDILKFGWRIKLRK